MWFANKINLPEKQSNFEQRYHKMIGYVFVFTNWYNKKIIQGQNSKGL